jgi:hypothetical protein
MMFDRLNSLTDDAVNAELRNYFGASRAQHAQMLLREREHLEREIDLRKKRRHKT